MNVAAGANLQNVAVAKTTLGHGVPHRYEFVSMLPSANASPVGDRIVQNLDVRVVTAQVSKSDVIIIGIDRQAAQWTR